MVGVDAELRLGAALVDDLGNPRDGVGAHGLDSARPLGTRQVKESGQRLRVPSDFGPDDPPSVVVADDRQVVMALAVAHLVDADAAQARERVSTTPDLVEGPRDDGADRAPRDAEQLADGRLRRAGDKPLDLVLKAGGEAGAWSCPQHPGGSRAVSGALHPPGVGLHVGRPRPQVQCPPAARPVASVVLRAPRPALRAAPTRVTPRTHHHDQYLTRDVDADVLHDDALDAHQHPDYLPDSHTAWLHVYVAQTRV